jgi:hypothetical protein
MADKYFGFSKRTELDELKNKVAKDMGSINKKLERIDKRLKYIEKRLGYVEASKHKSRRKKNEC